MDNKINIIYNVPKNDILKSFFDEILSRLQSLFKDKYNIYYNIHYNQIFTCLYEDPYNIFIGDGDLYGFNLNGENQICKDDYTDFDEDNVNVFLWKDSDIISILGKIKALSLKDIIYDIDDAINNKIECDIYQIIDSNSKLVDLISDVVYEYISYYLLNDHDKNKFYKQLDILYKKHYNDFGNPIIEYNQNIFNINL